MAVTRRAWERVRSIRRSETEMVTGAREQHQAVKPGRVGMVQLGWGVELVVASWRACHLPKEDHTYPPAAGYVTVTDCESVPKCFPALNTFPFTIAFATPYIR